MQSTSAFKKAQVHSAMTDAQASNPSAQMEVAANSMTITRMSRKRAMFEYSNIQIQMKKR